VEADYIAAFMSERPITPEKAALVVIDMQYATGHRTGALARRMEAEGTWETVAWRFARIHDLLIPNAQRLLAAFRAAGRRVVFVTLGCALEDYSDAPPHMMKLLSTNGSRIGSPEHAIIAELAPLPGEAVINKTTIGAFASTGVDSLLRAWGCEQIYALGVSTNMCVETTAREAADRGYLVTLIEDACATTSASLHEGTLRNFQRLFGRVRSTAEVLAELQAPRRSVSGSRARSRPP
jgi:nicotinamidase-related amidase